LCFRKVTQEIFSELDETKARSPDIHMSFQKTEEETERGHKAPTPQGGAAKGWLTPLVVRPPWPTSDATPSPIKTSRREKPKYPITFPEYIAIHHRRRPEDREGQEALPGTLPERRITTGGLLHRHACLRRDE
jgi:hypothetical protein